MCVSFVTCCYFLCNKNYFFRQKMRQFCLYLYLSHLLFLVHRVHGSPFFAIFIVSTHTLCYKTTKKRLAKRQPLDFLFILFFVEHINMRNTVFQIFLGNGDKACLFIKRLRLDLRAHFDFRCAKLLLCHLFSNFH